MQELEPTHIGTVIVDSPPYYRDSTRFGNYCKVDIYLLPTGRYSVKEHGEESGAHIKIQDMGRIWFGSDARKIIDDTVPDVHRQQIIHQTLMDSI